MLVLERKKGDRVWIGSEISVRVKGIKGGTAVKLEIDAPASVPIRRGELEAFPPVEEPRSEQRARVLILEPDAGDRRTLVAALSAFRVRAWAGLRPPHGTAAERAAEDAAGGPPEIIFVSDQLREMPTERCVELLRRTPGLERVPLVVTCGTPASPAHERYLAAGAQSLLHRAAPFDDLRRAASGLIAFLTSPCAIVPGPKEETGLAMAGEQVA